MATGSEPRRLTLPGAELEGIVSFQTIGDARQLRGLMPTIADVVIVGGGFIGLEIAATCASLGKRTTVLEAGPRLMGRVVSPDISSFMLDRHRRFGVQVHLACPPLQFSGSDGKVTAVETAQGSIAADLVVVGIGSAARTALAETAGLAVEGGIVVDETLRTSDPFIWACGDAVSFPVDQPGGRWRLESVQNATDQGKHVALSLLGKTERFASVPWFWSDQGDIKLQMVGRSADAEESVVRGAVDASKFSLFHFAGGRLIGVDSINSPADHMQGRRILAKNEAFTPADLAAL
jgi:3-phenylpropionate/trans-cinnamate dioxygenase ferredoxin reductase subunit